MPTVELSTSHIDNFVDLMLLFPNVHPAIIHAVLLLSKNNFLGAIDRVLHLTRCTFCARINEIPTATNTNKETEAEGLKVCCLFSVINLYMFLELVSKKIKVEKPDTEF